MNKLNKTESAFFLNFRFSISEGSVFSRLFIRLSTMVLFWPQHKKKLILLHANNIGADQPAHVCRLISAFIICSLESICLFDLILYIALTIFQLYRDGSFWVEPVLS